MIAIQQLGRSDEHRETVCLEQSEQVEYVAGGGGLMFVVERWW